MTEELPVYGYLSNGSRTQAQMMAAFELLNSIASGIWINNYRLYTVSGSPFADSPSAGSSSLYWGPTGAGNAFAQYLSSTQPYALGSQGELQVGTSYSWANNTVYDIFAQLTTTSVTFLISAWSGPLSPPSSRFLANGGGQTCDPTGDYFWLGSVYYTGSAFFDYVGLRAVYNKYNQAVKPVMAAYTGSAYNYSNSAARIAEGQNATSWGISVIGVMQGEQRNAITLTNFQACNIPSGDPAATFYSYIGLNPTSGSAPGTNIAENGVSLPANGVAAATMGWSGSALGFNSFSRAEFTVGSATVQFDPAPASAMYGTVVC